jgi:hypothetical protein
MKDNDINKRQFVRFNSNELDVAFLSLSEDKFSEFDEQTFQFEGDMAGLVIDESYQGCSLILLNKKEDDGFMPIGTRCIVKVGKQNPLQAEVKWRKSVAPDVLRIGLEIFDFQIY